MYNQAISKNFIPILKNKTRIAPPTPVRKNWDKEKKEEAKILSHFLLTKPHIANLQASHNPLESINDEMLTEMKNIAFHVHVFRFINENNDKLSEYIEIHLSRILDQIKKKVPLDTIQKDFIKEKIAQKTHSENMINTSYKKSIEIIHKIIMDYMELNS